MKKISMAVLLLLSIGLTFRSCQVWTGCGYDCPVFPKGFPFQITATFGGLLGVLLLAIAIVFAIAALMGNPRKAG